MARSRLEVAGALGHAASDKRVELLRRVGEGGSISQAARDSGVSYKAAWQAIDTLSNLAGTALVERAVGGAGGGGARLTKAGHDLLLASEALVRSRTQVMRSLALRGNGKLPALGALSLRTSMRNQLPCKVASLLGDAHIVTVQLVLGEGQGLASRITRESAELLALAPGLDVLALCKATAVTVRRDEAAAAAGKAMGGQTINVLAGRATRVSRGDAADEVAAQLVCGLQLVGFAEVGSRLRTGSRVLAVMDASSVVIALA